MKDVNLNSLGRPILSACPRVHLLRCQSHNSPSCIRKGAGSRRKAFRKRHKL